MDLQEKNQTNENLTQYEKDLQIIQKLRLMDDDFMTLVFDGNTKATELLLSVILNRTDLTVTKVIAQREYKNSNANGRSIKLDIYAEDKTGKVFDIEVQRADRGASAQRARFNSSMMDTKLLRAGEDFSQLVETYVIFITEHDVIGAGLPLYHINRTIEETSAQFGDGSHIVYVNGSYKNDNDPVGKLMHDFRCTSAEEMFYPVLAERVRYFKESGGGTQSMCKLLEDVRKEAAEERNKEFAQALLEMGTMSVEQIAKLSKLPLEEVEILAQQQAQ
jgi:hypothetical protein